MKSNNYNKNEVYFLDSARYAIFNMDQKTCASIKSGNYMLIRKKQSIKTSSESIVVAFD